MSDSEILRPCTTLKLHRLSKRKWRKSDAMVLSSESEDESCYALDNGSVSDILSDSDSCEPMPVLRGAQKHWFNKVGTQRCSYRSHVSRRVNPDLEFGSLSTIAPVNHSSSFDLSNDGNDTTDDLLDSYASMKKFCSPPRPLAGLSMIEELSPITASNDEENSKEEEPFKSRLLWRPLQTSTTTSMPYCLPKTNPHHMKCSQIPSSTPRLGPLRTLNSDQIERPISYHEQQLSPKKWIRPRSEYPLCASWKREHIGLPAQLARKYDVKGKLNLTISLYRRYMTVNIIKAYYCLDPYQPQASSFIKVELRRDPQYRSRSRSLSQSRYRSSERFQCFYTKVVRLNNSPHFCEEFRFRLRRSNYFNHDLLGVSAWVVSSEDKRPTLLGCMTFPIRRLIDKAKQASGGFDELVGPLDRVFVSDGDYFLMGPEHGNKTNFPEKKIKVQKFYDEFSVTGTHSPVKLMREAAGSVDALTITSSYSGNGGYSAECSSSTGSTGNNYFAPLYSIGNYQQTGKQPGKYATDLDYTTESSSINSTDRYLKYHLGIPSITTTTSDCTSEFSSLDGVYWFNSDMKQLHAIEPECSENRLQTPEDRLKAEVRRRSASFCSPDQIKNERRLSHGALSITSRRKSTFLTKTLSFIKNKMDFASTSMLYPSKDEIRQWEKSFESLLNHKYGCLIFRDFLKTEYSVENLDFWMECEEFKKMKEGKKATQQRARAIFNQYIADQSPREVNLDADTKAATKAALEEGAKPNTFSLAQNRIEHLMEKDSYPRFLKSDKLLRLLSEGTSTVSSESTVKDVPLSSDNNMGSFST